LYYHLTSLNNTSSCFTGLKSVRILCESHVDTKDKVWCPAGGKVRQIVGIFRQISGSKDCTRGETYGSVKDRVWVSNKCMAVFLVLIDGRCVCSRDIFKIEK
jgi:hypothetical protein